MCIHNTIYPLVIDNYTNKKKILFNCPINFNDFEDFKLFNYRKNTDLLNLNKEEFTFLRYVKIPCGICPECLENKARDWATRIMLESLSTDNNYFITLTYDNDHLPANASLVKNEISLFNKKLKTYLHRKNLPSDFRFYGVGEYGSNTTRPHYHVIYFNLPIPDLKFYKKSKLGDLLYNSDFISKIWNKGHVVIGSVTFESASYCARYCNKKKELTKIEKEYFKNLGLEPEFSIMSRRPGIGAIFLENHSINEILDFYLNNEKIYINGKSNNLPFYFIKKLKEFKNENFNDIIEKKSTDNLTLTIANNLSKANSINLKYYEFEKLLIKNYKNKEKKRGDLL